MDEKVIISLKEYNRLKEIESNINNGKILTIESHSIIHTPHTSYYTDNEIIEKLCSDIEELKHNYQRKLNFFQNMSIKEYRRYKKNFN